jgi:twinkle protein
MNKEDGERIKGKQACIKCKSSDAVSIYQKPDGTFDGHCFSCESYIKPNEIAEHYNLGEVEEEVEHFDPTYIMSLPMRGWKERRVGKEVTELYGVRSEMAEDGTMIKRHYPVTEDGELVGYHSRDCVKKNFYVQGKNKTTSEFFGQSLFSGGGKFLVICGGEEDAMSLQQALRMKNPKFTTAVVSPTNGEGSTAAQIKGNYEWVTSFEKVILMLDNDKPGRKATEEALKLLKPGQGYTAKLMLKDPNEYVKAKREDELVGAFWKAERHSPIDLRTLSDMWVDFEKGTEEEVIPFPPEFAQLNKMMNGGPAKGEITTLGALTSIGKTSYLMRWVYHWLMHTNEKPGLLLLESTAKEIVRNLLSIHIKQNLALVDKSDMNLVELKERFMELLTDGDRVISIDHQGSFTSADELFQKVEWMVMAMDVSVVMIDPLQQAVPSNENNVIDEFQDKLLKLAKKTNAAIFVVSHMRKPDGKDPHDVSEYNLKGSSSINQVSFNTILMSRDKTADDPKIRNSTRFVLVKCRRTGETGEAGWIRFYPETMEFKPVPNPYEELAEADEDLEALYGD